MDIKIPMRSPWSWLCSHCTTIVHHAECHNHDHGHGECPFEGTWYTECEPELMLAACSACGERVFGDFYPARRLERR